MPTDDLPEPDAERRRLGTYYALSQVGLEMVVPIALGWWLDDKLGSAPWLLVVGVILGFALGILHLLALTRNENGTPKDKEP